MHCQSFEREEAEGNDQQLEIRISDPQKMGEGMRSYVVYKISTRTNLPHFNKQTCAVLRRFNDFLGLRNKLVESNLPLGIVVPPIPEKNAIQMINQKMSKDEKVSSDDFIEKRRAALERFLKRVAAHPVLREDPHFLDFLQTESDLAKATGTSASSGAGAMHKFKMDEPDPWFKEKKIETENTGRQLRKLRSEFKALVTHRKELSVSISLFAGSVATLSNCEGDAALSGAFSRLAEIEDKIGSLQQSEQANHVLYLMSELLTDHIGLISAIKEVYQERVKVYESWQRERPTLIKKREKKVKLEKAGKREKLAQLNEELTKLEEKHERGREEFERISKTIRKEVESCEEIMKQEFKTTLIRYIELLLEAVLQVKKFWESFLKKDETLS